MKSNVLISACLLGINCKYNGGNNLVTSNLSDFYNLIPICPESIGGLSTPRVPSEIIGDEVVNKEGINVTNEYKKGANFALDICKKYNIKFAILKSKSPSCGVGKVYNGKFENVLVDGDGVTAKLLKENNIVVYTENDIDYIVNNL